MLLKVLSDEHKYKEQVYALLERMERLEKENKNLKEKLSRVTTVNPGAVERNHLNMTGHSSSLWATSSRTDT